MKDVKFKTFSNKKHEFSLEVNCNECGNKFIEKFNIGSCPECNKKFDNKVKTKLDEWRSEGKPEQPWDKFMAMI